MVRIEVHPEYLRVLILDAGRITAEKLFKELLAD